MFPILECFYSQLIISVIKTFFWEEAPLELDNDQKKCFEQVLDDAIKFGPGDPIDYRCDYPKYVFLRYLVEENDFILHGSSNLDIEFVEPRTPSYVNGRYQKLAFFSDNVLSALLYAFIPWELRESSNKVGRQACVLFQRHNREPQ